MKYSEKLRDPRWQKKRLQILERDKWTCLVCGDKKTTLHVHHHSYVSGKEPWEYEDSSLATLCEDCHANETDCRGEYERLLLRVLKSNGFMADDVFSLASAFASGKDAPCVGRGFGRFIEWVLGNGFDSCVELWRAGMIKKVEVHSDDSTGDSGVSNGK